jgi:hypothetical protein
MYIEPQTPQNPIKLVVIKTLACERHKIACSTVVDGNVVSDVVVAGW